MAAEITLTAKETLLWLAALLDGEGSFTLNGRYPNIVLGMTDEDIVRLAHQRAGIGHVTGPHKPKSSNHKDCWRWKVSDSEDVFRLCEMLLPYMSSRRSLKIREILALQKPKPRPIWELLANELEKQ